VVFGKEHTMSVETITTVSPILLDHAVVGPPQGSWTSEHWERLPDDGNRYELIEGSLYMTTAPSFFHQWIIARLIRQLGVPAQDSGLGIWATAPIGVIFARRSAVQPDFLFIASANLGIIREGRIRGAPDLVVEVLSPGNSTEEMAKKRAMYAQYAVPEYVEIDPTERTLLRYLPREDGGYAEPQIYAETATVALGCLPGLPLRVGDLFSGAPDTTL
jgi:Uma2 family endonuclease